jgi:hypothetical protein
MRPRSEHLQEVRRVVLPSGRTIEVVYFETQAHRDRATRSSLHVCSMCSSELVHPVDWRRADRGRWEIRLRCPNCEWADWGVWEREAIDALDEALDRGTRTLVRDLRHLARANMEEEIQRFSAALCADVILPEDF